MLYSRYANPKELICAYIKRGRFGEFVENILALEEQRKREEAKKEDERMLWEMYLHSMTNESFRDWKKRVLGGTAEQPQQKKNRDEDLTDSDIMEIVNRTLSR